MNRSTFFKSVLAATAVFFGLKKATSQSLFNKSFSIGSWTDSRSEKVRFMISHDNCKTWQDMDRVDAFDLPFNGEIKDFSSTSVNPEKNQRRIKDGWMYL
jgi:hypothetical protein